MLMSQHPTHVIYFSLQPAASAAASTYVAIFGFKTEILAKLQQAMQ